ncbi:MAG: glutamyl-tRNA reductase [Chloroflexi bacterium]|nr:glutamyl-tRNA reductase [Chloroflexota bacterium]
MTARPTLSLLGVSHRTAPLELRERLAFTDERLPHALRALLEFAGEAYVLSTCNRTELYAVTEDDQAPALIQFLANERGVEPSDLEDHTYGLTDDAAIRHLFEVACGLDSMVLGEAQILGQVRDALEWARGAGTVGRLLGRALPLAIEMGKRARAETNIGRGAVSPSSVAVELARRVHGDLQNRCVLVIGAGEAGQATVRSLMDDGLSQILVVNRSFARAEDVAHAVGGRAVPFDDLVEALTAADIVISSTSSVEPVVSVADARRAMSARLQRRLLCIDIAVPRDIAPDVAEIPGVVLYNVDDLQAGSMANLEGRQSEVAAVESIIDEGLAGFRAWREAESLVPTIGALYQQAEAIRRSEMDRTMRRFPTLSAEQQDMIDVMTASIVRRILHGPVSALKAKSGNPDAEQLASSVRELFSLPFDEREPVTRPS